MYLAVVDYFSRYPEVQALNSPLPAASSKLSKTSFHNLEHQKFSTVVMAHSMPQMNLLNSPKPMASSTVYVTGSPLFAQRNGQVKRTIQTLKRFINESKDPYIHDHVGLQINSFPMVQIISS